MQIEVVGIRIREVFGFETWWRGLESGFQEVVGCAALIRGHAEDARLGGSMVRGA
jgi:hypothetical protein